MLKTNQSQESPAIDVCHIKDFEAFGSLRDAWNLLLQNNPVQDAFLTWEWLYTWWKHYGKPRELWLITAWIAEELVGIAPLMLEERRKYSLRLRVLCSLGTPDIDVGGFIVREGDETGLQASPKDENRLDQLVVERDFPSCTVPTAAVPTVFPAETLWVSISSRRVVPSVNAHESGVMARAHVESYGPSSTLSGVANEAKLILPFLARRGGPLQSPASR